MPVERKDISDVKSTLDLFMQIQEAIWCAEEAIDAQRDFDEWAGAAERGEATQAERPERDPYIIDVTIGESKLLGDLARTDWEEKGAIDRFRMRLLIECLRHLRSERDLVEGELMKLGVEFEGSHFTCLDRPIAIVDNDDKVPPRCE